MKLMRHAAWIHSADDRVGRPPASQPAAGWLVNREEIMYSTHTKKKAEKNELNWRTAANGDPARAAEVAVCAHGSLADLNGTALFGRFILKKCNYADAYQRE